jgi:methyltransferase family protein
LSTVAARPTLDGLLHAYRAAEDGSATAAVERVREAFARVSSLPVEDDDLEAFLGLLYTAVRAYRPRVVVQTGTFVGASAAAIGFGLADNGSGELYTIDPEPPQYFGVREPVEIARRLVATAGLDRCVHLVRGYATVALDGNRMQLPVAPLWRIDVVPPADVLVVDGDHTYEGCLLDLVHGAQALAHDGPRLVVVHDYLGIPTVRDAVRAFMRECQVEELKVVPSRCGIALFRVAGSGGFEPNGRRSDVS